MTATSPNTTSLSVMPLPDLLVRDLGRMKYGEALALQKQLQAEVIESRSQHESGVSGLVHLLLVEHDPPVITISRRPGARRHLLATDEMLRNAGVEIAETDRGGDITYHGPGQLVVYPILDLNRFGLRIDSYMRLLEQVVIDVLSRFGIDGQRDAGATGVWVSWNSRPNGTSTGQPTSASKICAMGVRVSRWVSMHGLALNVTTNLDHFNLIVPCGLAGRSVTSMHSILGERCPSISMVKQAIAEAFTKTLCGRTETNPVAA